MVLLHLQQKCDLILGDLDSAGGYRAEVGGEAGAAGAVPHLAPPQRRRRGRRRGGGDDGDGAAARALLVVPDHLGMGKSKHSKHWQCFMLHSRSLGRAIFLCSSHLGSNEMLVDILYSVSI